MLCTLELLFIAERRKFAGIQAIALFPHSALESFLQVLFGLSFDVISLNVKNFLLCRKYVKDDSFTARVK